MFQNNILMNKLFFIFFISFTGIYSQISFEASVSKKKLGINERLKIIFEMNENGDNFIPPDFSGFNIIGGPNQSVSNSWINGKRTFSKKITYFLAPKIKGKIKISQAKVEINGELYKTIPIEIEITNAVNSDLSENNPDYIADNNIHLVAEVSDQNPYLNESFTVVYKLYYSDKIGISNVSELDRPKFPDFWSQTLKIPRLEVKQGTYKGSNYLYVTWHKVILYPQKIGKLELAPLTLNISVDIPTSRRDFFGNRIYQQVPKVVTAGKRIINVKKLPEVGMPVDFNGAVGEFDLDVSLSKLELKASESLQAKIKIYGKGNLKLFELPKLTAPNSLEIYDPERKQSINTDINGMMGSIEDIYTVVPQNRGKFLIPNVSFSFFNPKTEKYIKLNSKENFIEVFDSPNENNLNKPNLNIQNNIKYNKDNSFSFIRLNTKLELIDKLKFWKTQTYFLILIIPFLILILYVLFLLVIKNKRRDNNSNSKSILAKTLSKKYLSSAKKTIGNKDLFYVALERALHNYLKAKLNIETTDFNKEKIIKLLHEKSIDKESVKEFVQLIKDCEAARYSPLTLVRMNEDFENALKIISSMDKQF